MSYVAVLRYKVLAVAMTATLFPAWAGADGLRTEIGVDYSTGKYGGALSTDIWSIPVSVGYAYKSWGLKATIPWLQVTGPGNVIPGLTPIVQDRRRGASKPEDFGDDAVAAGTVTSTTTSGIGDLVLSGVYNIVDHPDAWRVGLGGRVKIPTADETKNLGTGKADYAAQLELERVLSRWTPFLTIGYRWLGDTATVDFRNQPYGIGGIAYKLSQATSVDASFYWSAPSVTSGPTAADTSIGLAYYVTPNLRLTAYALYGLADGSPDWGAGIRTRWSF